MSDKDLTGILDFIYEIDRLKTIERKTRPVSIDRPENSAEHSWHLAVMAMVLADTANAEIDLNKVIKMLLLHDIPEVYADDVFIYDRTEDQTEKEREAARKLFSLLPAHLEAEFKDLWEEFEAGKTEESKFAKALDRFQPCFCNFHNEGGTWLEYGIGTTAVKRRNTPVQAGSETLWNKLLNMLKTAEDKGYFPAEKDIKYR